jgi:DNA-binding NarL/FixJ family response regulator
VCETDSQKISFAVVKPAVVSGATSAARPTVLLADDHAAVSKSVARLLAFDFDVVGVARDGEEAIDAVQRLDPDLVVLDVAMPGRDGFQTAKELERIGSRARIVFLSMHAAQEFVAEGFLAGARGYVLKTRLHADLVSALQRVLAGQFFVPSLESLFAIDKHRVGHAAQFHPDEPACIDSLSRFLNAALRRGDAVVLLASWPLRAHVATRLRAYGWNVGESGDFGRYRAVNVDDAVSSIVRGGRLDAGRVAGVLAGLERFRIATADGPHAPPLTLVGDVASQLVRSGNVEAALELERLWHELTNALPFLTVCCYPMTQFTGGTDADLLPAVCAWHHAITHPPEDGTPSLTA